MGQRMTDQQERPAMNVSGAVLRLWKAVPREVRLSFERHPVDDVRTLEAALREAMELHRVAVVYVLAATPRTERTDYIDRLGALEAALNEGEG